MRRLAWALAGVFGLACLPAAAACETPSAGPGLGETSRSGDAVAAELDLLFPDHPRCRQPDRSDCLPVPSPAAPYVVEGTLRWSWALDDCEYTKVTASTADVVINLSAASYNPPWLVLHVEPAQLRFSWQDQWDVSDDETDPSTGRHTVVEERDLRVSVRRVAEPGPADLDRLDARRGVALVQLRASADETPDFQPAVGHGNFAFDATGVGPPADVNGAPAPSWAALAIAIGLAALSVRRNEP